MPLQSSSRLCNLKVALVPLMDLYCNTENREEKMKMTENHSDPENTGYRFPF